MTDASPETTQVLRVFVQSVLLPMADIHLNIIELKAQVKRCTLPRKRYTVRVQD